MSSTDGFFVEVDCTQLRESGQSVSGDVWLHHKTDNRIITVLCDGAGSGVKANVVASVIASMVVNYARLDKDVVKAAQTAINTFACSGGSSDNLRKATFTIINITPYDRQVRIAEFDNPRVIIMRGTEILEPERKRHVITATCGASIDMYETVFTAEVEDRIVLFSDGVAQSGVNTRRMPDGWGVEGVRHLVLQSVENDSFISAQRLSRSVVSHAEMNDLFVVKNDMSCLVTYFRRPRKVLVVTGPPFDGDKDKLLAQEVASFDGKIIVSGGTTAQILSRELGRELSVVMKRDPSGLPPASEMEGCDLITEGVLTLGRVKALLETMKNSRVDIKGLDARYVRLLLEGDEIYFIVGTRVNTVHHDPNLPVEIELRRSVVKDIARELETKFMKRVVIKYI